MDSSRIPLVMETVVSLRKDGVASDVKWQARYLMVGRQGRAFHCERLV